ncbi:MAG: hypothetical protein WC802_03295 [Patescibacteria group bacterium]
MTQILSWNQIQTGAIPNRDRFAEAQAFLRERLVLCPHFYGAIMCGSVIMGSAEPWSDFDVLLMLDIDNIHKRNDAHHFVKSLVKITVRRTHIPLSVILEELKVAKRGRHSITIGFRDHLSWARENGGLVGKDPLEYIRVTRPKRKLRKEACTYIIYSIQRLTAGRVEYDSLSEEGRNRVLGKAFDLPFHATRRYLELHGRDCSHMGRQEVLETAQSAGLPKDMLESLQHIKARHNDYGNQVQARLMDPNRKEYERFIESLQEVMEVAIHFLYELGGIIN